MGQLVQFKNRFNGEVVEAEFPLPDGDVVTYTGADGEDREARRADFLAHFVQVVPDLPRTDASKVPTMAVTPQPGSHVALPAAAAAKKADAQLELLGEAIGRLTADVHAIRTIVQRLDNTGEALQGIPEGLHVVRVLVEQLHAKADAAKADAAKAKATPDAPPPANG